MKLCRANNSSCCWLCRLWHLPFFWYGRSTSQTRHHHRPNLKLLKWASHRHNQSLHRRNLPCPKEQRRRRSRKIEARKTKTSSLTPKTRQCPCWIHLYLTNPPAFGSRTRRDRLLDCVGALTIVQAPVSNPIPLLFARRPTSSSLMAPSSTRCCC